MNYNNLLKKIYMDKDLLKKLNNANSIEESFYLVNEKIPSINNFDKYKKFMQQMYDVGAKQRKLSGHELELVAGGSGKKFLAMCISGMTFLSSMPIEAYANKDSFESLNSSFSQTSDEERTFYSFAIGVGEDDSQSRTHMPSDDETSSNTNWVENFLGNDCIGQYDMITRLYYMLNKNNDFSENPIEVAKYAEQTISASDLKNISEKNFGKDIISEAFYCMKRPKSNKEDIIKNMNSWIDSALILKNYFSNPEKTDGIKGIDWRYAIFVMDEEDVILDSKIYYNSLAGEKEKEKFKENLKGRTTVAACVNARNGDGKGKPELTDKDKLVKKLESPVTPAEKAKLNERKKGKYLNKVMGMLCRTIENFCNPARGCWSDGKIYISKEEEIEKCIFEWLSEEELTDLQGLLKKCMRGEKVSVEDIKISWVKNAIEKIQKLEEIELNIKKFDEENKHISDSKLLLGKDGSKLDNQDKAWLKSMFDFKIEKSDDEDDDLYKLRLLMQINSCNYIYKKARMFSKQYVNLEATKKELIKEYEKVSGEEATSDLKILSGLIKSLTKKIQCNYYDMSTTKKLLFTLEKYKCCLEFQNEQKLTEAVKALNDAIMCSNFRDSIYLNDKVVGEMVDSIILECDKCDYIEEILKDPLLKDIILQKNPKEIAGIIDNAYRNNIGITEETIKGASECEKNNQSEDEAKKYLNLEFMRAKIKYNVKELLKRVNNSIGQVRYDCIYRAIKSFTNDDLKEQGYDFKDYCIMAKINEKICEFLKNNRSFDNIIISDKLRKNLDACYSYFKERIPSNELSFKTIENLSWEEFKKCSETISSTNSRYKSKLQWTISTDDLKLIFTKRHHTLPMLKNAENVVAPLKLTSTDKDEVKDESLLPDGTDVSETKLDCITRNLPNFRTFCFMNSVLQQLYRVSGLREYNEAQIKDLEKKPAAENTKGSDLGVRKELSKIFKYMDRTNKDDTLELRPEDYENINQAFMDYGKTLKDKIEWDTELSAIMAEGVNAKQSAANFAMFMKKYFADYIVSDAEAREGKKGVIVFGSGGELRKKNRVGIVVWFDTEHYIAYVKEENGKWFEIDSLKGTEEITEITEEKLQEKIEKGTITVVRYKN